MSHILIAEDSADDRELFTTFLELEGHSVTTVQTTDQLMAAIFSAGRPDALLLDLVLDRANGLEIVQTLRADTRSATLPIVAITAATPRYVAEVAVRAGCDGFLTKPCWPNEVTLVLAAAIRLRNSEAASRTGV